MEPTITVHPLLKMASGDTLSLQQYRFVGATPGKVVYIQANLHGAELAGNGVIHQLLHTLSTLESSDLTGEIRLVPGCNPLGVNTRGHHFPTGRFNPYDGHDWNRIFWDYEQETQGADAFAEQHLEEDVATIQLAYRRLIWQGFQRELAALESPLGVPVDQCYSTRLQQLALDADSVIDLHTSSNQGGVYLYYFHDRAGLIPYFDVDFGIVLDRYDGNAFDESFINPWLALEAAFAKLGRSLRFDIDAWTLELGNGMQLDPIAVKRGVAGVLNYLRAKSVLLDQPAQAHGDIPLCHRQDLIKYYATTGGYVQNRVTIGTWVDIGDPLYTLLSLNKTGQLPETRVVYAEQAGLVYDVAWNQAVNEGEYVLAMMFPQG